MNGHITPAQEPVEIGARVRMIRRRRGLGQDTAAGLAGISKSYLSLLENGKRQFDRRGLIEDIASALGCSPADITGQPYLPPDQESALARSTIEEIEIGLNDATLHDVPDLLPRPLDQLAALVEEHARTRDNANYRQAGIELAGLLLELHIHVVTGTDAQRHRAATLLTFGAYNAFVLATTFGYLHLAEQAAQRAYEAAGLTEQGELLAFAMFARAPSVTRVGGRDRALRLITKGIDNAPGLIQIRDNVTAGAQMTGLLHLMAAHLYARSADASAATTHLAEAAHLAGNVGEGNAFHQHFGPTNVAVWKVAIGAELGQGPEIAEEATRSCIDPALLGSRDRTSAWHFDLARSYGMGDGARDPEATRHLDRADRLAPQRIRNDPIARDLVLDLTRRAPRPSSDLTSLRNRFGIG